MVKSLFFAQRVKKRLGRSPPQELEEGTHRGPHLLESVKSVKKITKCPQIFENTKLPIRFSHLIWRKCYPWQVNEVVSLCNAMVQQIHLVEQYTGQVRPSVNTCLLTVNIVNMRRRSYDTLCRTCVFEMCRTLNTSPAAPWTHRRLLLAPSSLEWTDITLLGVSQWCT